MIIKDWKKEILTIPNLLSLFRLLLIPVYVVIYLNATETMHYVVAGMILAVSCLTDMIDGMIARHFNMISTVGQVLDPLADKCTQFTLTICLAIKHPILWIVAGLIFVKEIFQLVISYVFFRKGKMLSRALMAGKICTTVLFLSLILMVLNPCFSETVIRIFVIVDCAFLLFAFASYALVYIKNPPILKDIEK